MPNISKHIIIAEDSELDFRLLERAFIMAGFPHRLTRVGTVSHAIKYLKGEPPFQNRTISPLPDLLILDVRMAGGSASKVLTFLKEQGSLLPVVLFSGTRDLGDIQTALNLGAVEFLAKPDSLPEFTLLAQTIHYRWLTAPSSPFTGCAPRA